MGRKTIDVTVPEWGKRDDGKVFRLTELPASRAEKWAFRLFFALKGTTAEVPIEIAQLGMIAVAVRGLNSILAAPIKFEDVEPLLDEMFDCVQIVRDVRNHPEVATKLTESDVEEFETRAWLRSEVLSLHVGFGVTAALSTLWTMLMTAPTSTTVPTSPG